ncbi:aminopeptidase, partial [Escherichia coli]
MAITTLRLVARITLTRNVLALSRSG